MDEMTIINKKTGCAKYLIHADNEVEDLEKEEKNADEPTNRKVSRKNKPRRRDDVK